METHGHTVKLLNIGTDRANTENALKYSDQGLHCLPVHLHQWGGLTVSYYAVMSSLQLGEASRVTFPLSSTVSGT